jgi:hypothetical protein
MSIIAIAALSLGLAAPAIVEDTKPVEARPVAAGGYQPSDATRVCIKDTLTGSRVPRTVCDTMKGWKAKGVDPFKR